jgi:uncharacterized membrane protein
MAAIGESGEATNSTVDSATSSVGPKPVVSRDEVLERLLRWFFFSVVIAVVPIVFNGVSAINRNEVLTWQALLVHGEFYLVSVAVTAAALGEMFNRESKRLRLTRMCLFGFGFTLIVMASLLFADVASNARRVGAQVNFNSVAWSSVTFFVFSVIIGGCCIVVSEFREADK